MVAKIQSIFIQIINIMFFVFSVGLVISTVIFDKRVQSSAPNTVAGYNIIYYITALCILYMIYIIKKKFVRQDDISISQYNIMMITIPLLVLVIWQIPVTRWIYYIIKSDFGAIMNAVIGFSNGETFANHGYFDHSPNNANYTIILSILYNIFKNWRVIIFIGAVLTNVSAILVALTVKNVCKNRFFSIISLIIAEFIQAMTWRAFIVYTDNFAMFFIAIMIWLYSINLNYKIKLPLITLAAALGTYIKMTAFIPFLAMGIFAVLVFNGLNESKKEIAVRVLYTAVCVCTIFFVMINCQNALREKYGLNLTNKYPKSWHFMFMVGQNSNYLGVNNSEDSQIRNTLLEKAIDEGLGVSYVNNKLKDEALLRIKQRGLKKNIVFYTKKLNIVYNDGYFNNVQMHGDWVSDELKHNILYDILEKENGKYYQVGASILQIIWDGILLLIIICSFNGIKNRLECKYLFYKIALLGITVYLLLCEGRSKYLYMYLPIYVDFAVCFYRNMLLEKKEEINAE